VKGCVGYSRDSTAEVVKFVQEHSIKPVIAETFSFDEAVEAMKALQEQDAVGKIVVKIGEE
jgi:D-arabinose 1-dehydrogenase-like Zn-dependent alcohol dehydrogenase